MTFAELMEILTRTKIEDLGPVDFMLLPLAVLAATVAFVILPLEIISTIRYRARKAREKEYLEGEFEEIVDPDNEDHVRPDNGPSSGTVSRS